MKDFEQEAYYKLFGQNRTNRQNRMNLNDLLRGDSAALPKLYKSLFMVGAASRNTILGLEDMNTIGHEGDRHFVPVSIVPIELDGKNIVQQPPPNHTPSGASVPTTCL